MEAAAFSEGMNGVSNAPVSQTLMYSSTEASPLPVCSGASAKLFQCCPMGADFKGQGTGVNLGEPLGMTPGMQWGNVQSLNASHFDIRALHNPVFPFPTDPAFVERAVKFSTFGSIQHNVPPIPLNPSLSVPVPEIVNRVPEPVKSQDSGPGKKRKNKAEFAKSEVEESKGKRRKSVESDATEVNVENQTVSDTVLKQEKNSRPVPQKEDNYIHVRARRGQATDSHSLAERLRREKINERMKYLQELVPTCHKVTGKAVMLDEIINYVQSLQNQVAILSMKLATVNPTFSYNLESYMAKEECMPNKGAPIPYFQMEQQMKQSIPSPGSDMPSAMSSVESAEFFDPSNNMQKHGWESDLHNIYNDLHSLCDMEFIQGTLHRQ